MIEQEFEQLRDLLRKKLPDYLRQKGIAVDSEFTCLNPEHDDHQHSMSYDPRDCRVHCYTCGKQYDIFQIVGHDYNLTDFNSQFKKLHELFLGPLSNQLLDFLRLRHIQNTQASHQTAVPSNNPRPVNRITSDNSQGPIFEIESNPEPSHTTSRTINFNTAEFEIQTMPESYRSQNNFAANDSINSNQRPFAQPFKGNNSFGISQDNGISPYSPFVPRNNDTFHTGSAFDIRREEYVPERDFSDYYKQCRLNLAQCDYFKRRGISDETAIRFNLGFDPTYNAGSSQYGSPSLWHAVIIPLSNGAYTARNIDPVSKDRYRKEGLVRFFNIQALEKAGEIFITEGEMDALSLETLGYTAISLGGSGNVHAFLDLLRKQDRSVNRKFYISLDNDEAGLDATNTLARGLKDMEISYTVVDISFPYKDVNEALVKDREKLKNRLSKLDEFLTYNLTPLPHIVEPHHFITTSEEMMHLNLSDALYTFCLRPQTGRRLIASIIKDRAVRIVYAGSLSQWQYIASLIMRQHSQNQYSDSTYENARLLELTSDDPDTDLLNGITACKIQGEGDFVPLVDLTAMPLDKCLLTTSRLSRLSTSLQLPIIALCNMDASRYVEAQALQNLDINLNSNGDFSCRSVDSMGKNLDFTVFSSLN